jgi:hypothetical protein
MKKIFSIVWIIVLVTAVSCSQTTEQSASKNNGAVIKFETLEHDFGSIPYKGDGSYIFVFKNTGKEPLVLRNVRASCGCTQPEWPKDPINKGKQGEIKVSYNTKITGSFSKTISVFSNATEEPIILVIKGKVEEAAAAENIPEKQ